MADSLTVLAAAAGVTRRADEFPAGYRIRVIEAASIMSEDRWHSLPIQAQDFYNREAEKINAQASREIQPPRPMPISAAKRGRASDGRSVTRRASEIMLLNTELSPLDVLAILVSEGYKAPGRGLLEVLRSQTRIMLSILKSHDLLKTA